MMNHLRYISRKILVSDTQHKFMAGQQLDDLGGIHLFTNQNLGIGIGQPDRKLTNATIRIFEGYNG